MGLTKFLLPALLIASLLPTSASASPPPAGTPQTPTDVTTGLSLPWATSFLPDGQSALLTERDSFRVSKVALDGTRTTIGTVPNSVSTGGEGGLMGVAVSPTWNGTSDQAVYFFHTSNDNGQTENRIVRMNFDGSALSDRTVIVSGIRSNRFHNGGQLKFGPDGYLYAGTGDAQDTGTSQNNNSVNGKILRFTTSGAAAPAIRSATSSSPRATATPGPGLGLGRRMWSAELGDTQFDELNLIVNGHNYGWPTCQGNCSEPGMDNPKRTWTTAEASPSSLAIVDDTAYVAALRGQRLWRVELNGEDAGATQAYFTNTFGRLRSIVKVPGANAIWISTSNTDGDRLLRSEIFGAALKSAVKATINVSTAAQLKTALTSAKPGDTINLADGTYTGNFKTTVSGSSSSPITLTGSAKAVLTAGGGYGLHLNGASYWQVKGITVTGGQKGIMIDSATRVTIDGITVHGLDMEGVHFRNSSTYGTIKNSKIYDTGNDGRGMGEGVYVGSAGGTSDKSDNVQILDNTIGPDVGGEAIDLKEGTTGGRVAGNTFDGRGLTGANFDDSWIDVKGNNYVIENNTGKNTTNNGFETHTQQSGWGCGTVFRNNKSNLTGATGSGQYAFNITNYNASSCKVTIDRSNTVTGGRGLANPGIPIG